MKISRDLIRQARQTDLKQFLENKGFVFSKEGERFRCKEHKSLVIKNNAYFWNSRSDHGNAIDFLTRHLGYSFKDAVKVLTDADVEVQYSYKNNSFQPPTEKSQEKEKNYEISKDNINRAFAYLSKTRCIDINIISQLINSNKLKMLTLKDKKHSNIGFPITDENDDICGYEVQGTFDKVKFKSITRDTKVGYGFNIKDTETPQEAYFFESAIDLLSFYELKKGKLYDYILISMSGLKDSIVINTLRAYESLSENFICTDMDDASEEFLKRLAGQNISFKRINVPNNLKDWNDYLKSIKKNG